MDNGSLPPASLEIELPAFADREHWIDAGNFGRLVYGPRTSAGAARCELDDLRAKVAWLKGITLHAKFVGPHRLRGRPERRAPDWITEFEHIGLASSLIAQVRDIESQLIRAGVWRA